MLLNLDSLKEKYDLKIKGVLHIGAWDAWEAKQLLRFGYRPEDFPSFSEPRDLNLEELSDEERLSIILSAARGIKLYERPLLLSSLSRKELRQYHEKKKVEIFLETGRWDEF